MTEGMQRGAIIDGDLFKPGKREFQRMAPELAEFTGFTGDEVKSLCKEYGLSFEECRRWYDGYRKRGKRS